MLKKIKNNFRLQTSDFRLRGGFTLIELLVAMTIFLTVVTVSTEIFMMSMGGAKRLFGRQDTLDSARYIMESMAKEIRMSTVLTGANSPNGSLTLDIRNPKLRPQDIHYVFSGSTLTRRQGGGAAVQLNPAEVQINKGSFIVNKLGTTLQQPRVTIIMTVTNVTTVPAQVVQINLQTTISSREYGQ